MAYKDYDLDNLYADGVLGLGIDFMNGANLYIENIYYAGEISEPIFSLYLSDNGFNDEETNPTSALLLGEIDFKYTNEEYGIEIPASDG